MDLSLLATYFVSNQDGGRARLVKMIRERLTREAFAPNEVHYALWELPVPYLWSLNFDTLLESALTAGTRNGHELRVIDRDDDMLGTLAGGGRAVIKMHGGLDQLEAEGGKRLVITRDDFDTYISEFPRTWARLLADFYMKSMLFLGISFADPNMQTLLRIVRLARHPVTQQHYAVVKSPDSDAPEPALALYRLQSADLRRGGVEPVELHSFTDLPLLLKRAAIHARPANVMLSGSLPDGQAMVLLQALGVMLAAKTPPINLVHGGNASTRPCVLAFAQHIERLRTYGEHRVVQVRRSESANTEDIVHERRVGSIVFPGSDRQDVREDLCSRAAVCVVIGGEDATRSEVEECQRQGIRVIPVPVGSGYSQALWQQLKNRPVTKEDREVSMLDGDETALAERLSTMIYEHLFR